MSTDGHTARYERARRKDTRRRNVRTPGAAVTACGKSSYPTESIAQAFADKAEAERGGRLRVYHCPECAGWHLTSKLDVTIPHDPPPDVALIAEYVARDAHATQTDKAGEPYVGHLERVARRVRDRRGSEEQIAAAWLHDSVEDGKLTTEQIKDYGLFVYRLVDAMTHRRGESRPDYIRRVLACPGAPLIKRADHEDNMDRRRLLLLDPDVRDRLVVKYEREMRWLSEGHVDV